MGGEAADSFGTACTCFCDRAVCWAMSSRVARCRWPHLQPRSACMCDRAKCGQLDGWGELATWRSAWGLRPLVARVGMRLVCPALGSKIRRFCRL